MHVVVAFGTLGRMVLRRDVVEARSKFGRSENWGATEDFAMIDPHQNHLIPIHGIINPSPANDRSTASFPMIQKLSGIIHGKMIELETDPGFVDGQVIRVTLQSASSSPPSDKSWGDGIRAASGAFADWPEADKYLDEILQERKMDLGREIEE